MTTSRSTPIRRWLGLASLVLATASVAHAQYVWSGLVDGDFNDAGNWSALPLVNQNNVNLVFGEANTYVLNNDLTNLRFLNLTFSDQAGDSYTLSGNLINVQSDGVITNRSAFTNTIANALHFLGGLSAIDTGDGELVLSGATTRAGAALEIRKRGSGSLVLQGNHSAISTLTLQRGELVFDAGSTVASNLILTFNALSSGSLYGPAGAGGSATVRVVGAASGSTTVQWGTLNTNLGGDNGAAGSLTIVVDPNGGLGTTLDIASLDTNNDSAHPVRFDLSAAGSSVEVTLPNVTIGISRNVTVTSGGKTGFATQSGDNIVRYTDFTAFPEIAKRNNGENTPGYPTAVPTLHNVNYAISGDALIASVNGEVQTGSLTIQGAGTISGINANQSIYLQGTQSLLMEEGFVGDFVSDVRINWGTSQGYIHQYNTQADLYLSGGIAASGSATATNRARFVKTGAGTVIIGGVSDNLGGSIWVNEGRLELNGSLASVASGINYAIFVADTATLGGSGTLGTNNHANVYTGANRQARIVVAAGGTLDASNNEGKNALYIAGELLLHEGSIYHMTLGETRGNEFHIARTSNATVGNNTVLTITNADLSLELLYAPEIAEKILLLTWDSDYGRSGSFLTVNGNSFHGDNNDLFFLDFEGYDYEFQLVYDDGAGEIFLNVTAIPEPTTIALLAGLALAGAVIYRRRKNAVA